MPTPRVRTVHDTLCAARRAAAAPDAATAAALAERMAAAAQARLGRSLAVCFLDAGSCNGCELEARMLASAVYDLERFGIRWSRPRAMPTCCW